MEYRTRQAWTIEHAGVEYRTSDRRFRRGISYRNHLRARLDPWHIGRKRKEYTPDTRIRDNDTHRGISNMHAQGQGSGSVESSETVEIPRIIKHRGNNASDTSGLSDETGVDYHTIRAAAIPFLLDYRTILVGLSDRNAWTITHETVDYRTGNRGLSNRSESSNPYSRKAEPPRLIAYTLIKDSSLIAASTSIDSATNLTVAHRPRSETLEYQAFRKH